MTKELTRLNTILKPCSRTILLTGASGVVGQALLTQLHPHSAICLTHSKPIANPGVTSIPCDISLPQLGLDYAQFKEIAKRIDCIVHSAAITDFGASDEVINRINIRGAKNMLELAATAQVPFYYLSTAFVHPRNCLDGSPEHAYTLSKKEGERLVRESGLQYTIIRPSIVIGDSTTGVIARFQGIYNILGSWLRGFLPIMPMLPQAYIDFIPQDVLANAIFALIEQECVGREYWITSGQQALTARQIAEVVVEFAQQKGLALNSPRLVSPDIVDRLIRPAFMSALPRSVKRGFDWLAQVSPYLSSEKPFPTSLPELEARFGVSPLPSLETSLMHSLEYWASQTRLCQGAKTKDRVQIA